MTELDRQILDLGKKEKTLKKIFKKKINPFVSNAFLTVLVPYDFQGMEKECNGNESV